MNWRKPVGLGLGALLLAAMGLQIFVGVNEAKTRKLELPQLLPRRIAEWESVDLPMAETEALVLNVEKTLQFDSFVYRDYKNGNKHFTLYVAFWSPGKIPAKAVASHTPDGCWVRAGWDCTAIDLDWQWLEPLVNMPPAQYREFRKDNIKLHVIFWHLLGGEPFGYGAKYQPPFYAPLLDLYRFGLNLKQEQVDGIRFFEPLGELVGAMS
jgi:hypothetical protein